MKTNGIRWGALLFGIIVGFLLTGFLTGYGFLLFLAALNALKYMAEGIWIAPVWQEAFWGIPILGIVCVLLALVVFIKALCSGGQ